MHSDRISLKRYNILSRQKLVYKHSKWHFSQQAKKCKQSKCPNNKLIDKKVVHPYNGQSFAHTKYSKYSNMQQHDKSWKFKVS